MYLHVFLVKSHLSLFFGLSRPNWECGRERGGVVDLSLFFGFAGGGTIFGGAFAFESGTGLSGRIVRRESSLHDLQVAMFPCLLDYLSLEIVLGN